MCCNINITTCVHCLSTDSSLLTVDNVPITDLLLVLIEARDKWYFIGKALGCKDADLDEIDKRHHPDMMRCLYNMLKQRIQQGRLTLPILCDSLRGKLVERSDVADKIENLNPPLE